MTGFDRKAIRPSRLHRGDTIGIVAPSSPFDQKAYQRGIDVIHQAGFATLEGDGLFRRQGYLAGSNQQRAEQFNAVLADDRVQAVMCARGGFGSLKILDRLNFDAIGRKAKAIVGFSDITALHQAVFHRSNLITFHGPTVTTLGHCDDITVGAWRTALTNGAPLTLDLSSAAVLRPGAARGLVRGGNLATLCHLVGTPYLDSFQDVLLVIEDTGEALYRIDRMLSQMQMAGLFDRITGLMLGSFKDCGPADALYALILELFEAYDIPIVAGLDIGHGNCNITMPLGIPARLSTGQGTLEFLSSALED